MRLTPIALSAAIMVATLASAGFSQKPDNQIDPRSVALTQQAEAQNAEGHYSQARDLLESALAVDPRNRGAYIGLAHSAQGEKMFGEAIKFYFDALKLEPNDVNALAGQGDALVQRGAVDRAKQNLDRIRTICHNSCPQVAQLAAVIAKGPPPEVVTAERPEPASPKQN